MGLDQDAHSRRLTIPYEINTATAVQITTSLLVSMSKRYVSFLLQTNICAFIISTYVDGNPPESAKWFYKWLDEASSDFRVQKSLLKDLNYAVFGLGNSLYEDNFNLVCSHAKSKKPSLLSALFESEFGALCYVKLFCNLSCCLGWEKH